MIAQKIIFAIGALVAIFGFIFHLQGQSLVGPESSFMYSNPDWIDYGTQITIAGVIIALGSFLTRFIPKQN